MSETESALRDQVGVAWQAWLPALFDKPVPRERRATCESCAMCAPSDPELTAVARSVFNPNTKCCTYHPNLPAFSVGALLSDESPELQEGKARVRARIAQQHGVTPRGIDGPPAYWQRYQASDLFGRSKDMLCPYYTEGKCTVWKYREPVCATYYCKFDQGEDGRKFWLALRDYLMELNTALTQHVMLELGFEPAAALASNSREVLAEELDGAPLPIASYRARWKRYAGREESYFREAYAVVKDLKQADVEAVAGVRLRARLSQLTSLYETLREPLTPLRLKRNPRLQVERLASGAYLIEGYSGMDPSRVPSKLYAVLDAFDGRPAEAVVSGLKAQGRAHPSKALLRGLYQHRLLVDAGEDPSV